MYKRKERNATARAWKFEVTNPADIIGTVITFASYYVAGLHHPERWRVLCFRHSSG